MAFPITSTLLDYCVLAIVEQEDQYGYSFTQKMQTVMEISESTLYPVLRRLKNAHYLETYDEPYQGRNRRYYRITAQGVAQLAEYHDDWKTFRHTIETLTQTGGEQ